MILQVWSSAGLSHQDISTACRASDSDRVSVRSLRRQRMGSRSIPGPPTEGYRLALLSWCLDCSLYSLAFVGSKIWSTRTFGCSTRVRRCRWGWGGGFDSFAPEPRKFLGSSRASCICDRELAHEGNAERACLKRSAPTRGIRFDGRRVVEVMATGAVSSRAPRVERGLLKTG